jgi:hypothetical protein
MMPLTRRTFMQASLTSGLAVAAELAGGRWLLNPSGRLRIGILGLGGSAMEHLALYSAIPATHIVAIADEDPRRLNDGVQFLRENNQPCPALHRNIEALCNARSVDVISIPSTTRNAPNRILAAALSGRPVFFDTPAVATAEQTRLLLRAFGVSRSLVQHRLADFLYPNAIGDISSWAWRNSTGVIEAKLILSFANQAHRRSAVIASLDALLGASSISSATLTQWSAATHTKVAAQAAEAILTIPLPENLFQLRKLQIHPWAGPLAANSNLHLKSRTGNLTLPVAARPDATSSLQTVMKFLARATDSNTTCNEAACRSQLAANYVDHLLSFA